MSNRVQVGIIGLGRSWRDQFRPALESLRNQYEVRSVCSASHEHALIQAKQLGCHAAAGPVELLQRDDVEAVLLLDPGWYRLWPIEQACRVGKPVFCHPSLIRDPDNAESLLQRVQKSSTPVLMNAPLRRAPVSKELAHLVESERGKVETIHAVLSLPLPSGQSSFENAAVLDIVDWSCWLLGAKPLGGLASALGDSLRILKFHFEGGRWMQLSIHGDARLRRSLRLHVLMEHGSVQVGFPRRLSWTTGDCRQKVICKAARSPAAAVLEQFWQVVRGLEAPAPSLVDVHEALRWVRTAARSASQA